MKNKIKNKIIITVAFILSICFFFSTFICCFASVSQTNATYEYTNKDALSLKPILQEYVRQENESVVFYNQSCRLSSGENGHCMIGYDSVARAFYIMLLNSNINPNFKWCYKYDTDYVWKYYGEESYDGDWVEVEYFGIEFIGRTYNWGNYFELTDLETECQMLFQNNDDIYQMVSNYTYVTRTSEELESLVNEGLTYDVVYGFVKFDIDSEPFFSRVRCEQGEVLIQRLVDNNYVTVYKFDSRYMEWMNVNTDSIVEQIQLRFGKITSLVNARRFHKIFAYLNKPYYPVNNDRLSYKLNEDYIRGNRGQIRLSVSYIELSTGEKGRSIIGWSDLNQCFYIQMLTSNNPNGKWSYKYGNFGGTSKWLYRDVTDENSEFSIIEDFSIRFLDDSMSQFERCPAILSFMFTNSETIDDGYISPPNISTEGIENGNYYIRNANNNSFLILEDNYAYLTNELDYYTNMITITYMTNGKYKIATQYDYKALTAHSDGSVTVEEDYDGINQRWYIVQKDCGYALINADYSNKYLYWYLIEGENGEPDMYRLCLSNDYELQWSIDKKNISISQDSYEAGVRLAFVDGNYYYDYTIPFNELFEEVKNQCESHKLITFSEYYAEKTIFDGDDYYTEYDIILLSTFLWFYSKYHSQAEWDIKEEDIWVEALPNVPFLGTLNPFIFRGEIKTAEKMGNVMYGYGGRATRFGLITLYCGGGYANNAPLADTLIPPLYGDTIEDHDEITYGFNLFETDYPDYYDIAYNQIPAEKLIEILF